MMIKKYFINLICIILFSQNIFSQNSDNYKNEILFDSILKKQNNNWYSSRMSIELSGTNEEEFSAFVVSNRDTIIYINISKFGIEIARITLTPDTLTFLNRFEHLYYQGDYSFIKKNYGFEINFNIIQSIILAEDFKDFDNKCFKIVESDTTIIFDTKNRQNYQKTINIAQNIIFSKVSNLILKNSITELNNNKQINIHYLNYTNIDNYYFPSNYYIQLENDKIEINCKSSKVNIPGHTRIVIPPKYKPYKF